MAEKKYVVRLSLEERSFLEEFLGKGRRSAELATRARILLKADVSEAGDGWTDDQIVEALDTSKSNVSRTRQRLVETGLGDAQRLVNRFGVLLAWAVYGIPVAGAAVYRT